MVRTFFTTPISINTEPFHIINMQGRYWILTIPSHEFLPYLPNQLSYIRGQLEQGANTQYVHWQLLAVFKRSVRLAAVKSLFGNTCHAELTRSNAANDYVWKDDTAIAETRFELGEMPRKRGDSKDWATIVDDAKCGRLDNIPPDILVRYYSSLRRLGADYAEPIAIEREITVFWGPTGVGKSRRAWELAGPSAYPKDPNTKFWDGYRGHETVVMDEYRGLISISNLLRWFDRYPVLVEIKGSATVLSAKRIYLTSNLNPREWYPGLDELTLNALLRRLTIVHCPINLY